MAVVSDFTLYGVEEHQIDSSDNLTFLDAGTGNQLKLQLYQPVITSGGWTVPGTIFATGETDPTTGDGVAIYHPPGTTGYIRGYNYGSAAFEQLLIDGNPLDLNTQSNNPVVTGSSYFLAGGAAQIAGNTLLNIGSYVEIFFTGVSGPGNVRSYNETGAVYLVLDVDGSTLNLNSVSNGPIATGTGLVTFGGTIKVSTVQVTTIEPITDGIHAIDITNAAGSTSLMDFDTTNFWVGINAFTPACRLDVGGTMRATGETDPASGSGLELYLGAGNNANILAFNRSGSAYLALSINGLTLGLNTSSNGAITLGTGNLGFFGHAAAAKPTVTGSKAANAALTSLLTALAGLGLLTDSST